VAHGDLCLISLVFTPSDVDNRPAQVGITDDAPGSPHMVSLTGVGTATMTAPWMNLLLAALL